MHKHPIRARLRWMAWKLDAVHFCKASKAKYRTHLTVGVVIATTVGMIGVAYGHPGFAHFAAVANCVTAIMWIWE